MRIMLNKDGKEHPMSFRVDSYSENGNLYVGLITHENGYPAPQSNLTVNLSVKCEENCAFIDTNNNGNEIINWLLDNGLGMLTGRAMRSGFCVYPEFVFFPNELSKYISAGAREMV